MKPIRQLYLGVFLVDFLALALLLFSSMRAPNFFAALGDAADDRFKTQ